MYSTVYVYIRVQYMYYLLCVYCQDYPIFKYLFSRDGDSGENNFNNSSKIHNSHAMLLISSVGLASPLRPSPIQLRVCSLVSLSPSECV